MAKTKVKKVAKRGRVTKQVTGKPTYHDLSDMLPEASVQMDANAPAPAVSYEMQQREEITDAAHAFDDARRQHQEALKRVGSTRSAMDDTQYAIDRLQKELSDLRTKHNIQVADANTAGLIAEEAARKLRERTGYEDKYLHGAGSGYAACPHPVECTTTSTRYR